MRRRNRAGQDYEPASESVNRRASTHVYKGTTRQMFKDDRQQLETRAKRIRSLVIETPAIPSQLDVGFYLHRKGPN